MNVALFDQVKMRLMKAGLHPMCLYKRESLDIETDSYSRRQCEDRRKMLSYKPRSAGVSQGVEERHGTDDPSEPSDSSHQHQDLRFLAPELR